MNEFAFILKEIIFAPHLPEKSGNQWFSSDFPNFRKGFPIRKDLSRSFLFFVRTLG